jgi:hypothetical protein
MNLATEIVTLGGALWLAALVVATAIERTRKRREDEAWVDSFIERHRYELTKHYRDGRFRSKNLWNQPR